MNVIVSEKQLLNGLTGTSKHGLADAFSVVNGKEIVWRYVRERRLDRGDGIATLSRADASHIVASEIDNGSHPVKWHNIPLGKNLENHPNVVYLAKVDMETR